MSVRLFLVLAIAVTLMAADSVLKKPMPAFKAKSLKGEAFSNASLKGKPYLLQFWTTWCNYCRSDQPAVEQFIREKGREIPVICINVKESRETVTKYLSTAPRSCKVVLTEDTNLTDLVKPTGFPKYVLVDAKGNVGSIQNGAGGIPALRDTLAEAGLKY